MNDPAREPTPSDLDLDHPTVESVTSQLESGHPALADIQLRHLDRDGEVAVPPALRLRIMQGRQDPVRTGTAMAAILAENPDLPALWLGRARNCYTLGQLGEAIEHIRRIRIPPRHPKFALVTWWHARILVRAGRLEEATPIAEELTHLPNMRWAGEVLQGEIDLLRGDLEPARDRLLAVSLDEDSPTPPRFDACFHLARTLDRLGDCDGAFGAAERGNHLHPNDFDPDAWDRETDAIIDTHDETWFRDATRSSIPDESPVFLVGMPRSGTSLLEQILASHPEAGGVGERQEPFLIDEDVKILQALRPNGVTTRDLDLEARLYLDMQKAMHVDRPRIVNKALDLDRVIGTLARVLPGARFIHLERNPRDTILSIHQHNINFKKYPWSRELGHIVRARMAHERLMAHWKRMLDTRILSVNYESIVTETRPQIERITSFLGLDFDAACLRFHELDRAVITPSHDQIRKPLNAGSIGRWRRYEHHLTTVLGAFPPRPDDPDTKADDH